MIRFSLALVPLILAATPALAQSHAGHGATSPATRQAPPTTQGCVAPGSATATTATTGTAGMNQSPASACPRGTVPARAASGGHDMSTMGQAQPAPATAGHDMSTMPMGAVPSGQTDPHAGHDMSGMAGMAMPPEVPTGADNPGRPPQTPPPAGALDGPSHVADQIFSAEDMAAARRVLVAENGDIRVGAVMIDQLEATSVDGEEGYAWDAQGWYGGDIHRFWWKSEGEGEFGGALEEAELQALYSRAFTPYFDFQTGLRQTYRPEGDRTDLVVGVQGLAPYWFELDAAAFLSNKGELTARAEAEYDQRITQRLILQPRAEVNLSAEDIPELGIGAGLSTLQVGARLRYEIRREFAPYVGVEWTRSFGATRDFAEARGRSAEDTRVVVGVRAWF
ncbi:copper resistance protein B [Brevundimonas bullata]|uniref:Copper resistance protein B n=1 Tax=Brevundimonas bullata TaxID=13160 RepID=A0A7W7IQL6_9CAUL|nr:copper resistance protein B [Brevundimonas bullata]MBB4798743.1 copper resistance protein B [Brevundimonas bullata]MBB6383703.1 copper resistance protein B [Brevundimonas bullata]